MERPEAKNATSGNVHLAFRVLGSGPIDVLLARSGDYHLEIAWDHPLNARYHRELRLGRWRNLDRFRTPCVYVRRRSGRRAITSVRLPAAYGT